MQKYVWMIEFQERQNKWRPTLTVFFKRKLANDNCRMYNRYDPGNYRVVKYEAVCPK